MKSARVSRIFHTVGQGAFYSEEIDFGGKSPFVMVYDCGSLTMPPKRIGGIPKSGSKLEKKIHSDLGSSKVNILFISHFDADHINGCDFLDPTTVVIPFINPSHKWILEIIGAITGVPTLAAIFLNPRSVFQNAQIIRVEPENADGGNEPDTDIDLDNPNWFAGAVNGQLTIKSGTSIFTGGGNQIWEYIPWNPNLNKFFQKFENEVLNEPKLNVKELQKEQNGKYIISHLADLKKIYDSMSPKNDHSLQLYSGPNLKRMIDNWTIVYSFSKCYNLYNPIYPPRIHKSSCLYFGDIEIDDKWLHMYYTFLGSNRLNNVGSIQIPHHGSVENKGWKYLNSPDIQTPLICVISVGEDNQYGHPSSKLIANVLTQGPKIALVTEKASSMLMEIIALRYK